eukprot:1142638-Pelagomonas_calceolata.AAC.8
MALCKCMQSTWAPEYAPTGECEKQGCVVVVCKGNSRLVDGLSDEWRDSNSRGNQQGGKGTMVQKI